MCAMPSRPLWTHSRARSTFIFSIRRTPLIRTWQRIFPDMFKSENEMPAALRAHVRYPTDMLKLRGLVYAKYHMNDPTVFYNQEDLWVRATEKYYDRVEPVEPYYIIWELPDSDHPEFVLILTSKEGTHGLRHVIETTAGHRL